MAPLARAVAAGYGSANAATHVESSSRRTAEQLVACQGGGSCARTGMGRCKASKIYRHLL